MKLFITLKSKRIVTLGLFFLTILFFLPNGFSQVTITLGSGTSTSSQAGLAAIRTSYTDSRAQYVIRRADIINAGGITGTITSLSLYVTDAPGRNMQGFSVKMKNTTATTATGMDDTGLTTVYYNSSEPTGNFSSGGWRTITFSTPFGWNGCDNLLVDICFDNSAFTAGGAVRVYNAGYQTTSYEYMDHGDERPVEVGCTMPNYHGHFSNSRPQMRLTIVPGSGPVPTQVGSTASANGTIPAAPSCTNWSGTWCAGSGTHSVLSLTNGVNYTVENLGTAACGTAMSTAYMQAWGAGTTCSGFGTLSSVGTNSVSFNANRNGAHRINVTTNMCSSAANTCGGATGHDFTGQSAVLRYRQNTTVTNTTSTAGICSGGTLPLTYTLGGAHNNPTVNWSIVSGGGSFSGSNYLPGAYTGAVTLRATVGYCSSDVSFTVGSPSTAPTSVTGGGTYCQGNQVTLTQSGGTLVSGAHYEWFSGSCGSTVIGTGPSINVSPGSGTTYYVRASSSGGCPASTCASTSVTVPNPSGFLSIDGESATCVVSENGWVHFYNSVSGRLLCAINSHGQNLGNVTATSYVQVAPFEIDACAIPTAQNRTAVLGRRWVITPQIQPSGSVDVRLYFDGGEYSALSPVANSNANMNDNTVTYGDLYLSKYSNPSNPSLVNSVATDNCPSGITTIWNNSGSGTASSVISGFDANGLYTEYTISGFSEFWLHGSSINSPLPVTLTGFRAECMPAGGVELSWETATEQHSSHYVIERSRDGYEWDYVGELAGAGTTNTESAYVYRDASVQGNGMYYRLIQVDTDGAETLYGPVQSSCEATEDILHVYPNPASDELFVEIAVKESLGSVRIGLYDMSGKRVYAQGTELVKGQTLVQLHNLGVSRGVYLLRIDSEKEHTLKPVKVVIK